MVVFLKLLYLCVLLFCAACLVNKDIYKTKEKNKKKKKAATYKNDIVSNNGIISASFLEFVHLYRNSKVSRPRYDRACMIKKNSLPACQPAISDHT